MTGTGSITISGTLVDGTTSPISGSPSFNPNCNGVLLGFDLDSFNSSYVGISTANAASYSISTKGGDSFTDQDNSNITDVPAANENETDGDKYQDSGKDTYALTINGSAGNRQFVVNETSNDKYTDNNNDAITLTSTYDKGGDTDINVDSGTDNSTEHEVGTLAPDGTMVMTSFSSSNTIGDRDVASISETDKSTDPSYGGNSNDGDRDNYSESDTTTGTETTTVTGTGSEWSLTESDTGNDINRDSDTGGETTDSTPASGETEDDVESDSESANGSTQETLTVSATGQGDTATINNLSDTVGNTDIFTSTSTQTDVTTTATTTGSTPDVSKVAETSSDPVDDISTVTVTGPGSSGYAVNENDTITDTYTDGDGGGDTFDDPYTACDGTTGTDIGSDSYSDSDKGSEQEIVSSSGTLDALGNFTLGGFTATLDPTATANGSDGGIDNESDPTDNATDGDRYTDNSQGVKETETIQLTDTDGAATTSSSSDTTLSGLFNSTDAQIGASPDSTSSGMDDDTDHSTNQDQATITLQQLGTLDSSGNLTLTGGADEMTGTNQFYQNNDVDAAEYENPIPIDPSSSNPTPDELVNDDDLSSGTDKFDIQSGDTSGSLTSMSDDETIKNKIDDTVNITPMNSSGPDTGSAQLGGTMNAVISLIGNSSSGAFQLAPESGNDQVNLNGQYHDKKVVTTAGFDPNTGDPYLFPAFEEYQPLLYQLDIQGGQAPQAIATITTQLNDTGIAINESDSDNAGQVTIGTINYNDNPTAVTTTVVTFTPQGDPSMGIGVTGTMGTIETNTQSQEEKVSGGGPVYQTDMTTKNIDTLIGNMATTVTCGEESETGNTTVKRTTSSVHTIEGTEGGTNGPTLIDKTVNSSSDDTTAITNGSNNPTYPLASTWKETNRVGSSSSSNSQSQYTATAAGSTLLALTSSSKVYLDLTASSNGEDGDFNVGNNQVTTATDTGGFSDGQPTATQTFRMFDTMRGVNPIDGDSYKYSHNTSNPISQTKPTGDWFEQLSDFAAGIGDTISGGLTQKIRQKLGYDDVVNKNSPAYKNGQVAGEVLNIALQAIPVCKAAGLTKLALRGINGVQGAMSAVDGVQALSQGDWLGGLSNLANAGMSFFAMSRSCFVAGTPIESGYGAKAIEEFKSYEEHGDACDWILSKNEFDPSAEPRLRRVLKKFETLSSVLNLHVGGRIIGTTAEHPFFVKGRGWTPAGELRIGDELQLLDAGYMPVEGIADSGRVETVYNLSIDEDHTYFVGSSDWGWSLWSHNRGCTPSHQLNQSPKGARSSLRNSTGRQADHQAHHVVPWELRDEDAIKYAASGGFEMNRATNGILLPVSRAAGKGAIHNGSHSIFTDAIRKKAKALFETATSPADMAAKLQSYIDQVKAGLAKSGGTLR